MIKDDDLDYLSGLFDDIKDEHITVTVSEWAEKNRYLPKSVAKVSGFYSFTVTPYLREIADCMSLNSPVQIMAFMKGVQIGASVGILENTIGYGIEHVKTAPFMSLIKDGDTAELRVEENIIPMLQHSKLQHLIQSNDESNGSRKTGQTKKKISWFGGGYLLSFGSNNAAKLRSFSIQYLLIDEPDAFAENVGSDGDPVGLAIDRTASFGDARKIALTSTPLIKGRSQIEKHYELGDKRKYLVPCKHCGHHQELVWNKKDKNTGEVYGLVFNHDDGVLDIDSVRYICEVPECRGEHKNPDKYRMLQERSEVNPDGAYWQPTATPSAPYRRSYHISALYAPVSNKSWEEICIEWFACWDVVKGQPKNPRELQRFYNNNLGKTFRYENDNLKLSAMWAHRRTDYRFGEVPNQLTSRVCGSDIMLVTCAVDVHKNNLAVAVVGWTKGHRAFVLDYWRIEGEVLTADSGPWQELTEIIYNKRYVSENGKIYPISLALIDSGYEQDLVMDYCARTEKTIPIKGIDGIQKGAQVEEFKMRDSRMGITAFNVNVDLYKDRWYTALKRPWIETEDMHDFCFNVPTDVQENQLRELTRETKVPDFNKTTNVFRGFKWHRPSGAQNEFWDLLIYNNAAIDILAWDIIMRQAERDHVNWNEFWQFCESGDNGKPYFYEYVV
ncbi:terminase large subunit [Vibrio phage 1.086.O._10N.222.51.F8]|nr:terminase large subunit [Vibrio phage 1.086.O._10N.222.51.F8]